MSVIVFFVPLNNPVMHFERKKANRRVCDHREVFDQKAEVDGSHPNLLTPQIWI